MVARKASVLNGERQLTVATKESTFIPARNKRRLSKTTDHDLMMIDLQSGAYFGENDIVRFDDKYGRLAASSA